MDTDKDKENLGFESVAICAPSVANPLPAPRCEVAIRPATMDDLPFVDALQKKQSKQLGWMSFKTLEGKIAAGHVLVAWATRPCLEGNTAGSAVPHEPIGYCIGSDKYMKHEDVGIIYQLNVASSHRRSLVGASLIKAMFDRAAYGCKLFCCWCAQDIDANHFWESIGFVPIAFRAGSEKKSRVHIFWQRRIREGDTSTPYWFPSETTGGAMGEGRLVLPIPPGTHWSDAKPLILPPDPNAKALPGKAKRQAKPVMVPKQRALGSPLWFGPPPSEKAKVEKVKTPRVKRKNDPKMIAAARELRDRYLEQFNSGLVLSGGKYEVCKQIESRMTNREFGQSHLAA